MKTELENRDFKQNIYNNFINGNLSDFKKQINSLDKISIFKFVQYLQGYTNNTAEIVNYLARQETLK